MKKELFIGICITVLVLLIAPTVPAQEYTQIENAYEEAIQEQYQELQTILLKDLELTDEQLQQRQTITATLTNLKEIVENSDESTYVVSGFIMNLIISLLFSLIGTIFGVIFGPILAALILVIVSPALFLAKIIEFLNGNNVSMTN
jgi:predicted PurR-regulated permease PerM